MTRLIEHPDRVIVGLSDGRLATATHVHAALPAWEVAAMLDLHREARPPRLRSVVCVLLVVDGTWGPPGVHHLADPHVLPVRVTASEVATGRTVLCAEVPCEVDDEVWAAPADSLAARVADDLVRCGLPDPRPVAVHVERLGGLHVVPTRAAFGAVARAGRALTSSRRVTVLGRPGLDPVDDVGSAIELGIAAARCVGDDGSVDLATWAREQDRFRSPAAAG